jgi:hypothetical protein
MHATTSFFILLGEIRVSFTTLLEYREQNVTHDRMKRLIGCEKRETIEKAIATATTYRQACPSKIWHTEMRFGLPRNNRRRDARRFHPNGFSPSVRTESKRHWLGDERSARHKHEGKKKKGNGRFLHNSEEKKKAACSDDQDSWPITGEGRDV